MSNKDKKNKQKGSSSSYSHREGERLKTVVRRLPPNLPEDIFWASVQTWVTDESVAWKTFCAGKLRKQLDKEHVPSRAYILFKNEEMLAQFGREYDGHVFRDKNGVESAAVVEFAPYQKIPPLEKRKVDNRMGTIEKDEDYISFLGSLAVPTKANDIDSMEALVAAARPPPEPETTPLLAAIKAEKAERAARAAAKEKETMRVHAIYSKDKGNTGKEGSVAASSAVSGGRKDDSKREKEESGKKSKVVAGPAGLGKGAPPKGATGLVKADRGGSASQAPTSDSPAKKGRRRGGKESSGPASSTSTNPPPTAPTPDSTAITSTAGGTAPIKPPVKSVPARPPRETKVRPPVRSTAAAIPSPTTATPTATTATILTPFSGAGAGTGGVSGSTSAAAPPARRGRPMIGLASRQFEAALSGAGVGKTRREREKKGEAASSSVAKDTTDKAVSSSATASAAVDDGNVPKIMARSPGSAGTRRAEEPPTSPRGRRGPRGRATGT